jgi:hypothetical protein
MRDEEDEATNEECLTALSKIGTDGVVQALWDAYPEGSWHFRLFAQAPLGEIHSDRAVAACLDLLEKEQDPELRSLLAQALVGQFSFEGNEAARKVLVEEGDLGDLRQALVTACTLMGQTFPELDGWRKEIEEERERWRKRAQSPPAPDPITEHWPAPLLAPAPEPPQTPHVRAEKKVGRNDPCPCGSGKKFKKCCLGKQDLL